MAEQGEDENGGESEHALDMDSRNHVRELMISRGCWQAGRGQWLTAPGRLPFRNTRAVKGRSSALPPDRGSGSRSGLESQHAFDPSLRLHLQRARCGSQRCGPLPWWPGRDSPAANEAGEPTLSRRHIWCKRISYENLRPGLKPPDKAPALNILLCEAVITDARWTAAGRNGVSKCGQLIPPWNVFRDEAVSSHSS